MDLHELMREHGSEEVADVLGVSIGGLLNKRSGQRPITIDDLFLLLRHYGSTFDAEKTVRRIGSRRWDRRRSVDHG